MVGLIAVVYFVVMPRAKGALFTTKVETGEVLVVSPAQAQVQITATGYVVAQINAKVAAKVPGRIAEIFVEEGQRIEKGAKVARLEDVDQRSALAAARARVAAARARAQTSRATLAETQVTLAREQSLLSSGVSPKATVEDLQSRLESLRAAVRAADAETAASQADVQSIEVSLQNYIIITPITGTVVDKLVEVGEGVSPGFGTPGVVDVVDLESLVVEIDIPESKLSQVAMDAPCEIILDAYPSQRYRGSVKELGRRVNRSKATVPVKVRFVDRPKEVLPDMAARVSFLREALTEAQLAEAPKLVVPSAAVAERDGAQVVFVVEDDVVRMTAVTLGAEVGEARELKSPILPSGTKVVLRPPSALVDGKSIKEKTQQ
ncbi:MAG: efflux RND transporter periplasmic adaptor subunit [Myxococcales bacterium]|nr:efflux RND transporter periplasmic adaptor subunit [Myxococcales bacterium]